MDIASATVDSHFDQDYQFSYEHDGMNFAVAFTAFDRVTEPILDPSYGKLVFNAWSWGIKGDFLTDREPLGTHQCTKEELGLERSE